MAAIDDLCEHQVDGLVLGVRVEGSIDAIRKLCHGVPFVALDTNAAPDVPNVIVDQQYGTRLAIEHLLDLGHQQIALSPGRRFGRHPKNAERVGQRPSNTSAWSWALASKAIGAQRAGSQPRLKLLEREPRDFTAIVAANDHMALGVLRALHAKGIRVPEQISVVGYDDLPESRFFEPPLTTIHHDFAGQGERCVEILLSMIKRQTFEPGTSAFASGARASARVRRWRDDDREI